MSRTAEANLRLIAAEAELLAEQHTRMWYDDMSNKFNNIEKALQEARRELLTDRRRAGDR